MISQDMTIRQAIIATSAMLGVCSEEATRRKLAEKGIHGVIVDALIYVAEQDAKSVNLDADRSK